MKIFSTKQHGFLDYLIGAVLLVAPTLLNLDKDTLEGMVFYCIGIALLFYSLFTDYELGAYKLLPINVHLAMDILLGIVLVASPWIFGFEAQIFIPHVILGVLLMGVGLTTITKVGVPNVQEIVINEVISSDIAKDKIASENKSKTVHSKKETSVPQKTQSTKKAATSVKHSVIDKSKSATASKSPIKKSNPSGSVKNKIKP